MPAKLALVGEGPELPLAEQMARDLGVREDVHYRQHDRIELILQASDLFLLPSNAESFGLSALEAMACGCPVLGYEAGGLPEVVETNVSGILCPLAKIPASVRWRSTFCRTKRATRRCVRRRVQAERFATPSIVDSYEKALIEAISTD